MISLTKAVITLAVRTCCSLIVFLYSNIALATVDHISVNSDSFTNQLTVEKAKQVIKQGPQLIVMWSLDCPACFEELDTLAQLLKSRPELAITLISTDDDPTRYEEVNQVYAEPAFRTVPRWVYQENQAQQIRYTIDPTWQGELPRSFYIDKTGKQFSHSGVLSQKQLQSIVAKISP